MLLLCLLSIALLYSPVFADPSTSYDSQCTGPIGLVTAFNHPQVVLVNQKIRYRNYRKLCRQNGYQPLMIRDERELTRVLRELKSLKCHHGPAWVDGYWRVIPSERGRKTPTAVTISHGGLVELYPKDPFVRYAALCRTKTVKTHGKGHKHHKSGKKCKKTKKCHAKRTKCKKRLCHSHYRAKRNTYPAKCLEGKCGSK